jgi:hypothetical protein
MPWKGKNRRIWPLGIGVQVQQQRSLIMIIKNVLHKIIYNEQID